MRDEETVMKRRISDFIEANGLLKRDGLYLVALSGGADSVALLRVLCALSYRVEAVHCNFHLRGEESDRDEQFCRQLCDEMAVSFHLAHFDTKTYASLHHVSIEMAARELRYNYFEQLRHDLHADGICVAHHRDDSIETLLLNLIRGTGLHGLTGIAPKNGYILRPMLCVSRDEIELFLQKEQQSYVTDSTNNEDEAVRNRIRHHVLPLLETINPGVRESLALTAARLEEADKQLQSTLKEAAARVMKAPDTLSVDRLLAEPSPEYVLFHVLSPYHFAPAMIEDIARYLIKKGAESSGKQWFSTTHQLLLDREELLLSSRDEDRSLCLRLPEPGVYCFHDSEHHEWKLRVELREAVGEWQVNRKASCATLDAAAVSFPLVLRYVRPGDRFVPFGMTGSKLVSDFLTDQRRSLRDKRRQLVVENANGDLLWLVNNRPDNRYRCGSETTKILILELRN